MKKIRILFIMVSSWLAGNAQATDADKAFLALHKLATTYQQAKLLSFDVLYTYAAEGKPAAHLDSLKGQCKLDGNRYWSVIDNTVSVCDNNILLTLFGEDSLMYLVRSSGMQGAANPAAMLDTLLLKNKDVQYRYSETATEQTVGFSMKGAGAWKKMTFYIDRKTGYISRMASLVRSDQMYDASVRSLVADAAAVYVVVEALYSNYRQGNFDEKVFDMARYFRKAGNAYVTQPPYEKYKVFIGSAGL